MLKLGQFLIDNWQSILEGAIVLLPTLIVGFSNYPRTDGVLSVLLKILNAVSLATHKDSPGSLKLPLTQSQPPPDHLGFARLPVLMALCAVAIGVAACSLFGPHFKQDEIDCGEAALHALSDKIMPTVTLCLADPQIAFPACLVGLEPVAGDAVACAVGAAVRDFEEQQQHDAGPDVPGASAQLSEPSTYSTDLAVARGHQYLAGKKTPVLPGQ